jgi:hypothetical protein
MQTGHENSAMGLNAWVHCNCVKEGKTPPHPFPELFGFEKTGEATLISKGDITLEQWLTHDKWYRGSCPHSGVLLEKRLGHISLVAHVRGVLERDFPNDFPLLLDRVVYNGTHTGDGIATHDVPQLLEETRKLRAIASDPSILGFANDLIELAGASLITGNPIVF